MQDVQSTMTQAVGSAVPSSHRYLVDQAITAFEEREYEQADRALQVATSRGLSETEARAAVEEIGLTFKPAPEPEVAASNGGGVDHDALIRAATAISEATQDLLTSLGATAGRQG